MVFEYNEIVFVIRRPSGAVRDVRAASGGGMTGFKAAAASVRERFPDSVIVGWRTKGGQVRQMP